MFNLLDAVGDQNWDLGGGGWSKVSQGGLHTIYINLYIGNMKIMKNYGAKMCHHKVLTSVFLMGVLAAVGLQGRGQRSRHSG